MLEQPSKPLTITDLAKGELISRGKKYFGANVNDVLVRTLLNEGRQSSSKSRELLLREREREVLTLVAQGYTNAQTADRLFLSTKTIETYRARLMTKLGPVATGAEGGLNSEAGEIKNQAERSRQLQGDNLLAHSPSGVDK